VHFELCVAASEGSGQVRVCILGSEKLILGALKGNLKGSALQILAVRGTFLKGHHAWPAL
jgi:hypothetical protein